MYKYKRKDGTTVCFPDLGNNLAKIGKSASLNPQMEEVVNSVAETVKKTPLENGMGMKVADLGDYGLIYYYTE